MRFLLATRVLEGFPVEGRVGGGGILAAVHPGEEEETRLGEETEAERGRVGRREEEEGVHESQVNNNCRDSASNHMHAWYHIFT